MEVHPLGLVEYLPTFKAMQAFTAARYSKTAQIEYLLSSLLPLPLPGEGWDGGTRDAGTVSALAPTLTLPRKGREQDKHLLSSYQIEHEIGIKPIEYMRNQLWICEHPAVYTQGLAGKVEHVLNPGNIPVVQTDRGGQVTFHGPGQVVAYPLIDLKAAGYYVKEYVYRVEEAVIRTLAHFGVTGHRVRGAPGIYVRLDDPFSHARLDTGNPHPSPPPEGEGTSNSLPFRGRVGVGASPLPNFNNLGKIAALGIKVSRHCTYHGVAFNVAMDLEPFSRINPCGYAGLQTVDLSTIGVSVSWQEAADVFSQKLVSYLSP